MLGDLDYIICSLLISSFLLKGVSWDYLMLNRLDLKGVCIFIIGLDTHLAVIEGLSHRLSWSS